MPMTSRCSCPDTIKSIGPLRRYNPSSGPDMVSGTCKNCCRCIDDLQNTLIRAVDGSRTRTKPMRMIVRPASATSVLRESLHIHPFQPGLRIYPGYSAVSCLVRAKLPLKGKNPLQADLELSRGWFRVRANHDPLRNCSRVVCVNRCPEYPRDPWSA